MTTTNQWHSHIKFFHWLVFLLVLATIIAVGAADNFERGSSEKALLMMLHKSFGVTVLLATLLLVVAHIKHGRPPVIGRGWQVKLSTVVHWGMIALLIGMPVFGLLMSQFGQRPVDIFGLFSIPVFLEANKELARTIHTLHAHVAAPVIVALILLHIGGALWHHFIDKDDTLKRMRPGS